MKKSVMETLCKCKKNGIVYRVAYNGNLFALVDGGRQTDLFAYKNKNGMWNIVDVRTGLSLCAASTRKKAIADAESLMDKYWSLATTPQYDDMIQQFIDCENHVTAEQFYELSA